jgi:hypothetical protein
VLVFIKFITDEGSKKEHIKARISVDNMKEKSIRGSGSTRSGNDVNDVIDLIEFPIDLKGSFFIRR